jgi:hypothetical protein
LASQDKCCKILELALYCPSVIIESHLASQTISTQDIPVNVKFKVKQKKKAKAFHHETPKVDSKERDQAANAKTLRKQTTAWLLPSNTCTFLC